MEQREFNSTEMIYGNEMSDKIKKFDELLAEINEKYIDFFKARPAHLPNQKHDNLSNHCTFYIKNGGAIINFESLDLPNNIKDECEIAFKKAFS
jgi:hypothetical protein